jgi:hypothetical protein
MRYAEINESGFDILPDQLKARKDVCKSATCAVQMPRQYINEHSGVRDELTSVSRDVNFVQ